MPDITQAEYDALVSEKAELKQLVDVLMQELALSRQRAYGRSSEQNAALQIENLFNEAEATAAPGKEEEVERTITKVVTVKRKKSKGQREEKLGDLPVEEIHNEFREEECHCGNCSGELRKIGVDTRSEVTFYPARIVVTNIHTAKYVCDACHADARKAPIVKAPALNVPFPYSLASASAVAYIIHQKYVNAIPLYRQVAEYKRLGLDLSRQTASNWVIMGADVLKPIATRLKNLMLNYGVLHADETPIQVLREEGRAATSESRMWLYCSREGPATYIYDYQPGRGGKYPAEFLKKFSGILVTDGYVGYEGVPNVRLAGCWAHARRKYADALKALPATHRNAVGTLAYKGLKYCDKIFTIERNLAGLSHEERRLKRLELSKPILDEYIAWLNEKKNSILHQVLFGKAVTYSLNQIDKLSMFLEDGRVEVSNNRAERAIRPFVIGRKNWLFCNTPKGADASSLLYSIIETAKAHNLNTLAYIQYLFETLPNIRQTDENLDMLLPWAPDIQARFAVKI